MLGVQLEQGSAQEGQEGLVRAAHVRHCTGAFNGRRRPYWTVAHRVDFIAWLAVEAMLPCTWGLHSLSWASC